MTLPSARSISISITDSSQVGETRRLAGALARQLELNEDLAGKAGIIATEAANNLYKHARDGRIFLRPLVDNAQRGVEILSIDKGPGMDVTACFQDGFSTAGTPGTGLGSILRLSSVFDVYSTAAGTVLLSQIWSGRPRDRGPLEIGAACVAMTGESACGDNWALIAHQERRLLIVADGLGHGPEAAQASNEAIRIALEKSSSKLTDILQMAHAALRPTRGAAVSIVEFEPVQRRALFAGIGNISGVIQSSTGSRSMVSHNGTVGSIANKFQEFTYPWPADGTIILHSDGINTRWGLSQYPGLSMRHPGLIAGMLFRDFQRERDDSTVVVVREILNRAA